LLSEYPKEDPKEKRETKEKQTSKYNNTMTTRNEQDSSSSQPPSFSSDPVAYLESIARSAPSKELLSRLAGQVAGSFRGDETASATVTAIAPLYLRAVAQQLAAETGVPATAGGTSSAAGNTSSSHGKSEVEAEMKSVHQIYEIAEVRLSVSTSLRKTRLD
jgi:hypothetical protein